MGYIALLLRTFLMIYACTVRYIESNRKKYSACHTYISCHIAVCYHYTKYKT